MYFANLSAVIVAALFIALGAHAFGVKKSPEAPKDAAPSVSASPSSVEASDRLWVKKPDGGLACDQDKKHITPLEVGRAELKKAGVEVFEAKKANDGMMRAAVCGIATGNENHFLILKKDAEVAKKLGYELSETK